MAFNKKPQAGKKTLPSDHLMNIDILAVFTPFTHLLQVLRAGFAPRLTEFGSNTQAKRVEEKVFGSYASIAEVTMWTGVYYAGITH